MEKATHRIEFSEQVDMHEAGDALLLSVMAAESLHGRAAIRLDAYFLMDRKKRTCLIDSSNAVGRDLLLIAIGFWAKEFGEDTFKITKI